MLTFGAHAQRGLRCLSVHTYLVPANLWPCKIGTRFKYIQTTGRRGSSPCATVFRRLPPSAIRQTRASHTLLRTRARCGPHLAPPSRTRARFEPRLPEWSSYLQKATLYVLVWRKDGWCRQTKYYNPRCACAPRVNELLSSQLPS